MMKAIIDELGKFPPDMRKTITTDREKEFTCWQKVEEKLKGTKLYATDPQILKHFLTKLFVALSLTFYHFRKTRYRELKKSEASNI